MQEYLELCHMKAASSTDFPNLSFHMPHHVFIKECSGTRKLCEVFNESLDPLLIET